MRRVISVLFILMQIITVAAGETTNQPVAPEPSCMHAIGMHDLLEKHPELTGSQVSIGLMELSIRGKRYSFLPNLKHKAFSSIRLGNIYHRKDKPSAPTQHATTIAGVIWGLDTTDKKYQAITPEAIANIYETKWFANDYLGSRAFKNNTLSLDSDIISISWGNLTESYQTRWWRQGLDSIADHDNILMVASCGDGWRPKGSITHPATNYNIISVGAAGVYATNKEPLSSKIHQPQFHQSSFGPTKDKRCKPEIIAPGRFTSPNRKDNDNYSCEISPVAYTSFAAPQVAAAGGILMDAARKENLIGGDDPRVVKAILMSSAQKLHGWHKGLCSGDDDNLVPLDYSQGAGLLNIQKAHKVISAGSYQYQMQNIGETSLWGWDLTTITNKDNTDNKKTYYLTQSEDTDGFFTATVCWNRHFDPNSMFTPKPMANIELELWNTDDNGQLLEQLDFSISQCDNLQHIYYPYTKGEKLALIVSYYMPQQDTLNGSLSDDEVYALAWHFDDKPFRGDRPPADIDANGTIDAIDMNLIATAIGTDTMKEKMFSPEDINYDGIVDEKDLQEFALLWIESNKVK